MVVSPKDAKGVSGGGASGRVREVGRFSCSGGFAGQLSPGADSGGGEALTPISVGAAAASAVVEAAEFPVVSTEGGGTAV
jgi:hypothetical protein